MEPHFQVPTFFWYQGLNLGPCAFEAGGGTADPSPTKSVFEMLTKLLNCPG